MDHTAASSAWLDDATLTAVRPQVRALLEQSPGFRGLPQAQQRDIAATMVRVASFMANPQGLAREEFENPVVAKTDEEPAPQAPVAQALAGVDAAKNKASEKIGTFAGADFKAGALQQGTEEFKNLIGAVDFPAFVGGLIQNVFQAIVNASIQQMQAYGDMLKSVAQTVDQFAQDNISLDQARGWLADKFPDSLEVGRSDDEDERGMRLRPRGEDGDASLGRINQELQMLKPVTDLSDADQEARLVAAARVQMARSRQQLLASMVLLGINRIVITDGAINAKVVFDFRASDQARRRARAALTDREHMHNTNTTAAGGGFLGWGVATVNKNDYDHMTTVSSSVDESSESKASLKAKLTGEVRVNFKSDYFPMEKLATPGMLASIQGNATPFDPNPPRPAAAPAAAGPAAPAAPAPAPQRQPA
jgi:hypothetical protein